jgi:hypothetical protein
LRIARERQRRRQADRDGDGEIDVLTEGAGGAPKAGPASPRRSSPAMVKLRFLTSAGAKSCIRRQTSVTI